MQARVHSRGPSIEANVGWNRQKTQTVEQPTGVTEAKNEPAFQRKTAHPNVSNAKDIAPPKDQTAAEAENCRAPAGAPTPTDRQSIPEFVRARSA